MNKLIKIIAVACFSFSYYTHAQQIVKTDTLSGTPLTISMDSRVNNAMENLEENCERKSSSGTLANSSTKTRVLVPNRELTNAEVCRQNPRILGYKIQLAVVKSNAEANQVKADFRKLFPNMKVETDASLRPNYKILAGSYFSKQSAAPDLSRIRQHFNTAVAVQYRVFCVEAK